MQTGWDSQTQRQEYVNAFAICQGPGHLLACAMNKSGYKALDQYRSYAADADKLAKEIKTQEGNCRKLIGVALALFLARIVWIASVNNGAYYGDEISLGRFDGIVAVLFLFFYLKMHVRLHQLFVIMACCHGADAPKEAAAKDVS